MFIRNTMNVNIPKQDEMISDEAFLKAEIDAGIHLDNPSFIALANTLITKVSGLPIKTVLDYGCGTGAYAKAFMAQYDVVAWEKFDAHKRYLAEKLPSLKVLDEPITTDLMLFIEVAEHMTDKELDKLFKQIQPEYVYFSSTSERTPFDAAWGHINVKEQSEWVTFFQNKEYTLIQEPGTPTTWSKLFKKNG